MLSVSLPSPLAAALNGRDVSLSTASDLDVHGRPADRRLVVFADVLQVFDPAQVDHPILELSFADAEQWRAAGEIGGGVFQARKAGGWVDVVRYSNSLADRFAKLATRLEERRKSGSFHLQEED